MKKFQKILVVLSISILGSCSDDDCTKTQTLYGNQQLGQVDREIVVPCDTPDPEPITESVQASSIFFELQNR